MESIKVIGIEPPGIGEVARPKRLIIEATEFHTGWGCWEVDQPTWTNEREQHDNMFFTDSANRVELVPDRPHYAYRVCTTWLVRLIDRSDVTEDTVLSHLSTETEGYRYDAGLGAIYKLFTDPNGSNPVEDTKWATLAEGVLEGTLAAGPDWERLEVVIDCLRGVSWISRTPATKELYWAIRLAVDRIRLPEQFQMTLKFMGYDYGESARHIGGTPNPAAYTRVLELAQAYELDLRANWMN